MWVEGRAQCSWLPAASGKWGATYANRKVPRVDAVWAAVSRICGVGRLVCIAAIEADTV